MRVGWARPGCTPDKELGLDDQAYVFDGFEVRHLNLTIFPNQNHKPKRYIISLCVYSVPTFYALLQFEDEQVACIQNLFVTVRLGRF